MLHAYARYHVPSGNPPSRPHSVLVISSLTVRWTGTSFELNQDLAMLSKIYKRKLTLVPAEIRLPPGGKLYRLAVNELKIPSLPKQIEQTLILFHFACRIDKCNFPPRIFTPKGELRHASCALPISLNEMQRLCPWTKRSKMLWILLTTIVYQVLRPARHHLPVPI